MVIGIPKESFPGERRVALIPAVVPSLTKAGLDVLLESGAGQSAGFSDSDYEEKGARISPSRREVFGSADIIVQVLGLGANPVAGQSDLRLFRRGQAAAGFIRPLTDTRDMINLAECGVTAFAIELIPRITRAQSMDALSSMSTVAGYKAVLDAADALPRMFPMLMTAAGTISPARVFILGAGVLGLTAIATARRLGASVQAYDIRPAVREEVESLGARFVELPIETKETEDAGGYAKDMGEDFHLRQQELLSSVIAESDVVITAAVVPGKKAPILITADMVKKMAPGSVIMDLAAERGGNCELSKPGVTISEHEVTIIAPINIASTVPYHSSQMYAKNMSTFLLHLIKEGELQLDMEDEIVRDTLVTRDGEVVHPRVRQILNLPPLEGAEEGNN